jgi:hypothetical protein
MESLDEDPGRQEHLKEIRKIMGEIDCPKDFACYKSGLETICAAKDIGTDICLECLEETPQECKFALTTGESYMFDEAFLCACPVRVYICKNLKE